MLGFGNIGQYALGEGPVPVPYDIEVIMETTEYPDTFLATLLQWARATGANVDIIEGITYSAYLSVPIPPTANAPTVLTAENPSSTSGTPSSGPARAVVVIIT